MYLVSKILSIQISRFKKLLNKIMCCSTFQMSVDPSEIVQAGSTVYEASPGSIPTTYIPTTSTGG